MERAVGILDLGSERFWGVACQVGEVGHDLVCHSHAFGDEVVLDEVP